MALAVGAQRRQVLLVGGEHGFALPNGCSAILNVRTVVGVKLSPRLAVDLEH